MSLALTSVSNWRPLPGDLTPTNVGSYQARAALSIAKSNPEAAYDLAIALQGLECGSVALATGDGALLLGLPDLARSAYALARRRFHGCPWRPGLLGEACARYGLGLVAYGLCDYGQALRDLDAGMAIVRLWRLPDAMGALIDGLADVCLTRFCSEVIT